MQLTLSACTARDTFFVSDPDNASIEKDKEILLLKKGTDKCTEENYFA